MKSWLAKFRISSTLDNRKPLSPALERAINRSGEARRFAETSGALERVLKAQLPKPEVIDTDHASIMRAIRTAANPPTARTQPSWSRWFLVGSVALVSLLGVFVAVQFSPVPKQRVKKVEAQSFSAAGSALEFGGGIVREAPAMAMSPLSDEIQRLDHDLAKTEQFLLASLP